MGQEGAISPRRRVSPVMRRALQVLRGPAASSSRLVVLDIRYLNNL